MKLKQEYSFTGDLIEFDNYIINKSILSLILNHIMHKLEGFKEGGVDVKVRNGIRLDDTVTIPLEDVNILHAVINNEINLNSIKYLKDFAIVDGIEVFFTDGYNFGHFPLNNLNTTKSGNLSDSVIIEPIIGNLSRLTGELCNRCIHNQEIEELLNEYRPSV